MDVRLYEMKFSTPKAVAALGVNPSTFGKIVGDYSESYGLELDGKQKRIGEARLALSFTDVARVLEFLELTRAYTYSVARAVAMVNDAFDILGEYIPKEAKRAYDRGEWPTGEIVLLPGDKPDPDDKGDEGPWLLYGRPRWGDENKPKLREKPEVYSTRAERDWYSKAGRLQGALTRSLSLMAKRTDIALSKPSVLSLAE